MRAAHRWAGQAANERGVALPLALLGLISASLLVTTALLTSSTELAISSAQQDATRSLYVAEGGLQSYLATHGSLLMADAGRRFAYQPPTGAADEAVDLSVVALGQQVLPADGGTLHIFSVRATPAEGGGRTVSTLVHQIVPAAAPLETNITSALTLGGNLEVNGDAFTVSGRRSACGSPGVEAARVAADSRIGADDADRMLHFIGLDERGNQVTGSNAIDRTNLTRDQLALDVLGGHTLGELIAQVPTSHRWGDRFSPRDGVRVWDGTLDTVPNLAVGERVAVVDANGGTVALRGGRGLLIVVNGDVEMQGDSRFAGIVITEGSFRLRGAPQVTGALISLARDVENRIDLNEEAEMDGHATIQFDACQVAAAQTAFGELARETLAPTVAGVSGWLETVR